GDSQDPLSHRGKPRLRLARLRLVSWGILGPTCGTWLRGTRRVDGKLGDDPCYVGGRSIAIGDRTPPPIVHVRGAGGAGSAVRGDAASSRSVPDPACRPHQGRGPGACRR